MPPTRVPCPDSLVDLAFLVDGSGSMNTTEFIQAQSFITAVTGGFDVAPDEAHVAIATYSAVPNDLGRNATESDLFFTDGTNHVVVASAVAAMQRPGGDTNTSFALTFAQNVLYNAAYGARDVSYVPRLLVVLTDGASQEPSLTAQAAASIRDNFGVKIFPVGVGNRVNATELFVLAGPGNSNRVFTVDTHANLYTIEVGLLAALCANGGVTTTIAP